jgi:hypothetical protein
MVYYLCACGYFTIFSKFTRVINNLLTTYFWHHARDDNLVKSDAKKCQHRYNTERVLNQDFNDRIKINKTVEELDISVEEIELIYLQDKEFEKTSLAYQFRLGHPLLASESEVNDLPTNMYQLHQYYMADSMSRQYTGFEALILSGMVFNRPEETMHHIGYDCLF